MLPDNLPDNLIDHKKAIKKVAILGSDYIGMKPTLHLKKGETVKKGMPLFNCKKTNGVIYTSPGSGKIIEVNRGARRVFQSIVIELDNNEDEISYKNFPKDSSRNISDYSEESIRQLLIETGLWTSIRKRPFSKVPAIDSQPNNIFITAMDTNPLMYDPEIIISKYMEDFKFGARILAKLTRGSVFICTKEDTSLDISYEDDTTTKGSILIEKFAGIHPAGNPGTHIHFLSPNTLETSTWYIGFQDVIAVGKMFKTGRLWTDRYISVAGTGISKPSIYKTRIGASITDFLTDYSIDQDKNRIISGSLLNGFHAVGPFAYLGRYFNQVSILSDQVQQDFLGWIHPGINKFSVMPTFFSKILNKLKFNFNTGVNGSRRAMVPIGAYEKVMPLDILATQFLRALLVQDADMAMDLGILDLDEEDLALCTFVDPGKVDYGPVLRAVLFQIETEEM
ncbi:MAG: Na(+)-translocating NADH-quinone reductase subunit A [Desulfobacula sp.]|nr:Na(+)-translocating NADH-quinone reductase subunit A [Desulfobacula sp.]